MFPDSDSKLLQPDKKKRSFDFMSKRNIILILIVSLVIYIGSILITYYAKKCNNSCSGSSTTTPNPLTTSPIPVDFRLPNNLKPFFYELEIQPFIGPPEIYENKSFTFEGKSKMHFKCVIPTKKIIFHSVDLNINSENLEFSSSDDPSPPVFDKTLSFDKQKQFVIVNLQKECKTGADYILVVPYSGVILTNLYGFYRGSYVFNNQTFYLASTHFEPVDARRAFPCFDEPALKAKFKLTMIRHKNFTSSLFNTPLISTTDHPTQVDWKIDTFEESLTMSSYLVAFAVSNFETIKTNSTKYNINIDVVARPEAIQNGEGDLALIDAANVLDFFSDYFNITYPMSKSTQIAIPNFNSGAMENWGLVTYREASLLYNNKTDTIANKHRVTQVVSHELAHQWFGDLVTPAWWNDLWLNEGFATWVENLGLNHTHPEWRDLDYFFVAKIEVLSKDSLESSHPISVEVNNPSEIGSLFDKISYDKGASVIRMMNAFLTEKTFQKGVSNYLNIFQFNNTVQDNLWEELTKAGHQDNTLNKEITVKDIMDTWTLQKGYPIVQVNRVDNELIVSQKRFLLNPLNDSNSNNEYKWFVPFTYTTKIESNFDFEKAPTWLKPSDTEIKITLNNLSENDWVIANVKHAGFYRVNYDEKSWKLLIDQLIQSHTLIDSISRAQLIDDSFNLGRAEIIDQLVYLNLTSYLVNEEDPLPFQAVISGIDYIYDMISSDFEAIKLLKKFYSSLIEKSYSKIGWNTTLSDYNQVNLQVFVMSTMCRTGNSDCINNSRTYFNNWIEQDKQIPSDFKMIVYSTIAESGTDDDWENLFNIGSKIQNDAERLRIFRALTKTQNLRLLEYLLKQSSNEQIIKRQDELTIVGDIASNYIGKRLVFDYLDQNWEKLLAKYGDISFTLPNFVKSATQKLNTEFDIKKIQEFLVDHPNTGIAKSAFQEALETVKLNVRWMETYSASVKEWLKSKISPN